jgi:hypothetical protein
MNRKESQMLSSIPKLLTFYIKCPNCGQKIYINCYSFEQARRALEIALIEHMKIHKMEKESGILSGNIDIKEIAEQHWKYTEGIIFRLLFLDTNLDRDSCEKIIELCHYLYVAAMVHGWKHYEDFLLGK